MFVIGHPWRPFTQEDNRGKRALLNFHQAELDHVVLTGLSVPEPPGIMRE